MWILVFIGWKVFKKISKSFAIRAINAMYRTDVSFSKTFYSFVPFCISHHWFKYWCLWEEFQKVFSQILVLFQSLNTYLSQCNPSCVGMFLYKVWNNIGTFLHSVVCSSCSRKLKEKVYVNNKGINVKIWCIYPCS